MEPVTRVPVGISACLLGERVRYDGDHKRVSVLADDLAARFDWVPVCPEVGAGMTVPREPLQLVGDPAAPRLVTRSGSRDWTDEMLAFSARELDRLDAAGICGFVFKSKSPSCDVADGMFARALRRRLPALPVADEVELAAPARREAFASAVLAFAKRHRAGRAML